MRLLIQRVLSASVVIDNIMKASIDRGFLVFLGVAENDTFEDADYLLRKLIALRVFEDEDGKMNLNIKQVEGSILLVSQFTLLADTKKGNRPSFVLAAKPEEANQFYEYFKSKIQKENVPLECGVFAADMKVHLINDGPVTIWIDSKDK